MIVRLLYILLVLVTFYLPLSNENLKLYILSFLLIVYNFYELRKVYLTLQPYFFISPIFLAIVVTFGLVFGGIVNFLLLSDGQYAIKGFGYKVFEEREWLTKTMFIACIAALATWMGYENQLGSKLYRSITNLGLYKKIYSGSVSQNRLLIIAVIAYVAKFYLFSIGLYGRIVSEEYFEGVTGYKAGSQIRILSDLSYVTFFFISILKFQNPNTKNNVLFFSCFALELFFGFIYGARGPFIVPFLILFIAHYYVKQRIRILGLALVAIAIYFAFTVVFEFKKYVLSKSFSRTTSTIEMVTAFKEQQNRFARKESNQHEFSKVLDLTLGSVTFVPETAVAIRQKDKLGMEGLTHPNILQTILKFPIDAFVPRFIQGENEFAWGFWFKEEVIEINRGIKYSIGMSPIGFLYMGGGLILVIIGFWFFGVLLQFAYPFLTKSNPFSVLVYLMVVSSLYNLDSIYSNTLIYVTRYVFIYPIIFWVMFDARALKISK